MDSNSKRIARNTLYLYMRMFLLMVVRLFSARFALKALGVLDYGIWNVVAGAVAMFQFLNASMSGCTSRFIAFEIGKGKAGNIQKVFSSALTIHIGIALCFLFACETFGLWFLFNKLVIPDGKIWIAFFVFQVSVICGAFSILQVPYSASLIASEKMDAYAYIEFLNIGLQFVAIVLLLFIPGEKLIIYGLLTLFIGVLIPSTYCLYCKIRMSNCKFRLNFSMNDLKPMLSFSLWDLYGNGAVSARTQGVNLLLNMFFGAVMNAASAIASNIQVAVMSFASNVLSAFRPQIVKSYAAGDYHRTSDLIIKASQYTTILLLLITIPLWIFIDYVLAIWLENPPDYAADLCKWVLLFNLIANVSTTVMAGVHATGKIKRSSFINGTLYLLVIPLAYFAYKNGYSANFAYKYNVVAVCLGMLQNIFILHKGLPIFSKKLFLRKFFRLALFVCVNYLCMKGLSDLFEKEIINFGIVFFFNALMLLIETFLFVMSKEERASLLNFVIAKLKLKR